MDYYALIYETVDDYVARRAQFRELPFAFPQKPTQSKNNPRYNEWLRLQQRSAMD